MDSDKVPPFVSDHDLKPEINETDAHVLIASAMVSFMKSILNPVDEKAKQEM